MDGPLIWSVSSHGSYGYTHLVGQWVLVVIFSIIWIDFELLDKNISSQSGKQILQLF